MYILASGPAAVGLDRSRHMGERYPCDRRGPGGTLGLGTLRRTR